MAKEPFCYVIVDCVDPLPKTREGNQYLLMVFCTSTRFLKAVSLQNIKGARGFLKPSCAPSCVRFFLQKYMQEGT